MDDNNALLGGVAAAAGVVAVVTADESEKKRKRRQMWVRPMLQCRQQDGVRPILTFGLGRTSRHGRQTTTDRQTERHTQHCSISATVLNTVS